MEHERFCLSARQLGQKTGEVAAPLRLALDRNRFQKRHFELRGARELDRVTA
jgi:hypothetical protein